MRKQLLVLAGVAAVTGVALAAAPEKPEGPRGDHPRRPGMERKADIKEALGLTDAQAAELKKLHAERQKKHIRMQADTRIARLELHELLAAPTVDEKAVRAKAKQLADLQAAAANDRVEGMLALRKVLNAEQAAKAMRFMHHRGGHRGAAFGPGGPEGPGGPGGRRPMMHRRGPRGAGFEGPQGPNVSELDEESDASDL